MAHKFWRALVGCWAAAVFGTASLSAGMATIDYRLQAAEKPADKSPVGVKETPQGESTAPRAARIESQKIRGYYVESRTCQVYTGPCFANAEMQLTGKEAILAWGVDTGSFDGVDISGLNVVMVVRSSDTLGFGGLDAPEQIKSLVIVDQRANAAQREALVALAASQTGKAGKSVVRIESKPITVSVDPGTLVGKVQAGDWVKILTRKARPNDCICTNEVAYYPPLAALEYFAVGVCVESEFAGRGLGGRWSLPNSRSAYLGEFRL